MDKERSFIFRPYSYTPKAPTKICYSRNKVKILVPEKASEGPEFTDNCGAYSVPHQIEIGESIAFYNPQKVPKQLV